MESQNSVQRRVYRGKEKMFGGKLGAGWGGGAALGMEECSCLEFSEEQE